MGRNGAMSAPCKTIRAEAPPIHSPMEMGARGERSLAETESSISQSLSGQFPRVREEFPSLLAALGETGK